GRSGPAGGAGRADRRGAARGEEDADHRAGRQPRPARVDAAGRRVPCRPGGRPQAPVEEGALMKAARSGTAARRVLAAAAWFAVTVALAAQQEPPTPRFRATVDVIPVDVTVIDRDGLP